VRSKKEKKSGVEQRRKMGLPVTRMRKCVAIKTEGGEMDDGIVVENRRNRRSKRGS